MATLGSFLLVYLLFSVRWVSAVDNEQELMTKGMILNSSLQTFHSLVAISIFLQHIGYAYRIWCCSIVITYHLDCLALWLALSVYIQLEFRSSYKKFHGRYDSLVIHYRVSVSQVSDGILTSSSYINQVLLPWLKQQTMQLTIFEFTIPYKFIISNACF